MYFLVLVVILLGGCQKDIDEHYEPPTYLLGNTYEFLEKRGNFTLFMEAVELAGFKMALNGGGLFSVFAPSDDVVKAYLSKIGKSSLKDIDQDELEVLIGFHIIEFSYKTDDFLAFSKTSSSEEAKEADGYAHRFKTLAREGVRERLHPVLNTKIKVFQREKFLPVISTTLLKKKRSPNYEDDYRFFFPDVNWRGDDKQFYVAGASVLESGIPVDNGYVYVIDKVMEPLHTVYDALLDEKVADKYSLFRDLYDCFVLFEFDQKLTQSYAAELGDSLFLMHHYLEPALNATNPDLPDIADEWTVDPDNEDFEARMRITFNSYIPNNDAINKFCETYFADYFGEKEGLTDPIKLPLLTSFYLLSSHVPYGKELVMPSDFDKGVEGVFGEKWPVKKSDIVDQRFCSNGLFYGINTVLEPAIFSMITMPLFKYERFSTMAMFFHKTGNLLPLVDVDRDYSLFLLSNNIAKDEYGYTIDYNGFPDKIDVLGDRVSIKRFSDELGSSIVNMSDKDQVAFVMSQTVDGFLDANNLSDRKFFATREPYTYIYQDKGNVWDEAGNSLVFVSKGRFDIEYEEGLGRGVVYEVEDKFEKKKENIGKVLFDTKRYSKFYKALLKANLIKLEGLSPEGNITSSTRFELKWLNNDRCMVFAPTNDVLDEKYLPTDPLELELYLKMHFISLDVNRRDEYTLPYLGPEGKLETKCAVSLTRFAILDIRYMDNERLSLTYAKDQSNPDDLSDLITLFTDKEIPFFATDGLVYGIDRMMILPEKLTTK